MKQFSTYALTALCAFGVAACSQTNQDSQTPDTPASGNTYAALVVSQVGEDLRSETNQPQKDEAGRAVESGVSSIDIVGEVQKNFATAATVGTAIDQIPDGQFARKAADADVWATSPFVARAGQKKFGLALNHVAGIVTDANIASATFGTAATMVEDIKKLTEDNKFPMTSQLKDNTIVKNITKAQVKGGQNLFEYDVERVVAHGIVQKAADLEEKTTDGFGKVDPAKLTFSAINGATSTYYMADKAGSRKLGTDSQYAGFKSRVHDLAFADGLDNTAKRLVRLGDAQPAVSGQVLKNDDLGGYKAIAVKTEAYDKTKDSSKGIYFLENSVDHTELMKPENKAIGFYRVAHAKVYTTFIPTKVYKLADGVVGKFVEDQTSNIWWLKTTEQVVGATEPKVTYSNRTISETQPTTPAAGNGKEWVRGRVAFQLENGNLPVVVDNSWTTAKTFYIGEDNVAYATIEAAQAASYHREQKFQKFHTYTDGKTAYRAAWNKQLDGTSVINCDARRNSIYHLTISGFFTIGMNWDPSDPNDPNLPKPTPNDPDENPDPKNPQPSLEPEEGYMSVKSTVLPWNFVARDKIILG